MTVGEAPERRCELNRDFDKSPLFRVLPGRTRQAVGLAVFTTRHVYRPNNSESLVHLGSPDGALKSFESLAPPKMCVFLRSLGSFAAIPF
jgi:hypothetical protein